MSDLAIILVGVVLFVITTIAALWTGYLVFQRHWVEENPDLTDADDHITPLLGDTYEDQRTASAPR